MRGPKQIAGLFLLMTLAMLAGATGVAAQGSEPPPLPIIYQGEVFLDGEGVASGMLSARVGDWTSDFVPVTDGTFRCADPCLLVGPPRASYVGEKVTFHLEEAEFPATFSFEFPNLPAPRSDTVQLFFESEPNSDIPLVWLIAGAAGLVVVAGGGYVVVRRRKATAGTR
jgi:hypothetical protein